jgi:hypothetical protein
MKHAPAFLLVTCLGALLSGCGSEAVYIDESFANDSPFKLKVSEPAAVACESARRSLLGQGYLIDITSGEQVKGRKAYRRDDSQNTFIEMNVVCIPDRKGSTLYTNGVLSTYDLKKSGNSASVGISAVGSISLPIGQSADSLVKIAEETIEDKAFYGRFFAAVGHVLKEMEESPEDDEAAPGKTEAADPKPAPEADIPLEPGPANVPGIVPEPGPAPTAPAAGTPQPVVVPEPGTVAPAVTPEPTPAVSATPTTPVDTTKPAGPGPVQGFSVSAPAALPHAQPAAQPQSAIVPASTTAPQTEAPSPQPSPAPAAAPSVTTPPAATQPTRADAVPAPSSDPVSAPSTQVEAPQSLPAAAPATATPTPKAVAPDATTPPPSAQPTAAPPT